MKNLTFTGIDVNLETSLFEYGLILSNELHEDGSGTQFAVYLCGYNKEGAPMYDTGHYTEKETNNLLRGHDWMKGKDIGNFYDWIGCTDIETYIEETDHVTRLYDLITYFGTENIMGSNYNAMTQEEVRERYLSVNTQKARK